MTTPGVWIIFQRRPGDDFKIFLVDEAYDFTAFGHSLSWCHQPLHDHAVKWRYDACPGQLICILVQACMRYCEISPRHIAVGTGLLQLFTFGGLGIWTMVDFIMIVTGNFTDGDGTPIKAAA